jgi:transmembrane sensor
LNLVSQREDIEEQAARWVAREDRGLSPEEAAARDAWLAQETAHKMAYLRLQSGWQRTERLGAFRPATSEVAGESWLLRHRALVAAAAVLTLLTVGGGLYLRPHQAPQQTYVARGNARPILHLADGTRIQLNADTQVRTDVTKAQRTVMLEHGEAYFDVVHDARRPFVVIAGNRRITDLGTKFSVRRDGDDVKVIVKEGRVRVDIVDTGQAAAPVYAVGGNVVVAKSDETLVANASAKELDDQLSWRTDMLEFHQETLAAAAAQFNRYNQVQIMVQGPARDIRIGGSFRADNVDVFVLLVRNALGLKVQRDEEKITISQ